jgi:hypothetical protein
MNFTIIYETILKFIRTPDGVLFISFFIYIIIHGIQHKKTEGIFTEKFSHLDKDFSGIKSIEEKIDKYIWKRESHEARRIDDFLNYVFAEERKFVKKAQIELRDFIRDIHDFDKTKEEYYDEIMRKVMDLWEGQRKILETQVDVSYMSRIHYVANILSPMVREHIRSIVNIVLDKSLNGSREKTIDLYLLEAFMSIRNVWEDLVETEIKKDLE